MRQFLLVLFVVTLATSASYAQGFIINKADGNKIILSASHVKNIITSSDSIADDLDYYTKPEVDEFLSQNLDTALISATKQDQELLALIEQQNVLIDDLRNVLSNTQNENTQLQASVTGLYDTVTYLSAIVDALHEKIVECNANNAYLEAEINDLKIRIAALEEK